MASTATRASFTFNLSSTTSLTLPKLKKSHLTFPPLIPKPHSISSSQRSNLSLAKSIDVSKEDKPTIPDEKTENPPIPASDFESQFEEEIPNFDKRRVEEKFAVLNTGIYECRSCGYKYDVGLGDSTYPIPPGLPFDKLPDDWRCPTCGASKNFFDSKSVEIAGFAENQQFGLGGNTLTSGQKSLLIWGGLAVGFFFFLSGYLLQ